MIFIAHRGNTEGINFSKENHPEYINSALDSGFHAEIDLWKTIDGLFLGHDKPDYKIDKSFLDNDKFFVHCKNIEALEFMSKSNLSSEYFWHENDHCTLTSKLNVWVFPGKQLIPGSIAVMPEVEYLGDLSKCYAVCSDYVLRYKEELKLF